MSDTMTPNTKAILSQFSVKCQEHMRGNGLLCDNGSCSRVDPPRLLSHGFLSHRELLSSLNERLR